MSSYNNGNYPLSHYLSSLSSHQDIIHNPYIPHLPPSPSQMVSSVPDSLIDYTAFNVANQQAFEFPEGSRETKKPVKKDRHSKIHTAQGLRDRRVRLSIGVARQFFDLQDMLGFDIASKTLDWLLKKSRKAIKAVAQAKKLENSGETLKSNEDDVEEEKDDDDDDNDENMYGSIPECYEQEVFCEKRKNKSEISSKGSRAKDKGKGKSKEMAYDHQESISYITQSETMDPFKRSTIFDEGEDKTNSFYKAALEDLHTQESILTKSKTNLPTNMDQSYNQYNEKHLMIDQSSSSNYDTILPQTLDYSYDQNLFIDQTYMNFPRGFP